MESCIVVALVLLIHIHRMLHSLVGKLHQEDEVQPLDIHPSLLAQVQGLLAVHQPEVLLLLVSKRQQLQAAMQELMQLVMVLQLESEQLVQQVLLQPLVQELTLAQWQFHVQLQVKLKLRQVKQAIMRQGPVMKLVVHELLVLVEKSLTLRQIHNHVPSLLAHTFW